MASKLYLSKSKYCSAVQCPKMLWLTKYKPDLFDNSVLNDNILESGNQVGDLAMGLFGPYTEVPFGDLSQMVTTTQQLLKDKTDVICEASFSYDNCYCAVDILKRNGDSWEIYEVKSSTAVKDIYIHDVSYQYYVLTNCGLNISKVSVVHLNTEYVRHGELELDKLFKINDVTTQAQGRFQEVGDRISFLKTYMLQTDEPSFEIGSQCSSPYDCGFWCHCVGDLPSPSIFDISGRFDKRLDLFKSGIVSYQDLLDYGDINDKIRQQVEFELYDYEPYIDVDNIKDFLTNITYPLYFLDFETFQSPVPLYDDSVSYQQITFQYSLHWIEKKGGELKHTEFLAYPGSDPRRALAEQLCHDIPLNVCTTAYNMGFEKGRIREMAQIYPDLHDHLMDIHDHIQDLMVPFQKRWFYTKAMKGSYSIKYVLPALYPNDPSLDYHNLEGVHNGGEASATFLAMQNMDNEQLEVWRAHLLKYCGLDTYAMVKVWEKLCEVVEKQ